MLNHNAFPKFSFHHRGIHVTPIVLRCIAIPEGILGSKFLRFFLHLKIIRRQRGQIIHLIPTVDVQNLTDRPKSVSRVKIAISEVFFQSPHALISLILVKVEPHQIVNISSFYVHYIAKKSLTGHL